MITAITFQYQHSKRYIAPRTDGKYLYGEESTDKLIKYLEQDIVRFQQIQSLVADLNSDLSATDITEKIEKHLPNTNYTITTKTKTKRTYGLYMLTIHEEDQF